MELARADAIAKKGINWGKLTFEHLLKKDACRRGIAADKATRFSDKDPLRDEFESNLKAVTELDAGKELLNLSIEDQCKFFSSYPNCKKLIIRGWNTPISDSTLRCISIVMGESLLELDLSYSAVGASILEIMLSHVQHLRILRCSHCPNLDSISMGLLAKHAGTTLKELYVDNCIQFRLEPLLALSGSVGFNAGCLKKLRTLDLSECPADDRGLISIAKGCCMLSCLSLENCRVVTDKGVIPIVQSSTQLRNLNLSGCVLLTNKSALNISTHCRSLTSLNLSKCTSVSNIGVQAVASCCPMLQRINLSGIIRLSEESLYVLVTKCPFLVMLNVTGCESITSNGLKALISGLKYVEISTTFTGFRPINDFENLRKADEEMQRQNSAVIIIQKGFEKKRIFKETLALREATRLEMSARVIQGAYSRYRKRMYFYHIWMGKKCSKCALDIQRVWRGRAVRKRDRALVAARNVFLGKKRFAILIQKTCRGHYSRRRTVHVAERIVQMYVRRWAECEVSMFVRLQSFGRRFLTAKKMKNVREVYYSRKRLERTSCVLMQSSVRRYIASRTVMRLRHLRNKERELRYRAAVLLQNWYVRTARGRRQRRDGTDMFGRVRTMRRSILLLQRSVRGYQSREKTARVKIKNAVDWFAAALIQRVYRGSRVPHWRDLRMNFICAFVLARHVEERDKTVGLARERYGGFLTDNRRDSASESDTDVEEEGQGEGQGQSKGGMWRRRKDRQSSEIVWVAVMDYKRGIPSWRNSSTGEVVYVEPVEAQAHEKAMVGQIVRVYWVVERFWYEGTIIRYNSIKERHKILYTDGDCEWMNLEQNSDRVQVMCTDGSWVMYSMFETPGLVAAHERAKERAIRESAKAQAYSDARQWTVITSSPRALKGTSIKNSADRSVMLLSEKTGQMRTGYPNAADWVIEDDGHGYPVFVNKRSRETSFEDPRFEENEDEDTAAQRDFVMGEVRFAGYFCAELLETYLSAKRINIEDRENEDRENDVQEAVGDEWREREREKEREREESEGTGSTKHTHTKVEMEGRRSDRPGGSGRVLSVSLTRIAQSSKPKHLAAHVLRARALYRPESSVERTSDVMIDAELDHYSYIASQLALLVDESSLCVGKAADAKRRIVDRLTRNSGQRLDCPQCLKPTQRHLQHCPTCGKIQIFYH